MNISTYIKDNYRVSYMSETISSPEEATIYFLSEVHNNTDLKEKNAAFIDKFPHLESLILVEGTHSLKEVNPHEHCQTYALTNKVKTMGWDSVTVPELLEMNAEKTQAYLKLDKLEVSYMKKEAELRLLQRSDPQASMIPILEGEIANLKKELDTQLYFMFELLATMLSQPELIYETAQLRNQSMIQTLDKTSGLATKRFVIAGVNHLEEGRDHEDPRTSLQPLKDYLKDKKAVILIHKEIS